MSEELTEAAVIEGRSDIGIRIRNITFSLPKSYSGCVSRDLVKYAQMHKALHEEIAKNSIWSPAKYEALTAHQKNLDDYTKQICYVSRPRVQLVLERLVKKINSSYESIRKPIVEEINQWS